MVCHCVAPSAKLASFVALGTVRMASSATVIIVGSAMIASTILPARAVSPTGNLNDCCKKGTITTRPKKPYTTDGIPARSSISGFKKFRTRIEAISARYTATAIPNGNESRIAPRLTQIVPNNNGNKPY